MGLILGAFLASSLSGRFKIKARGGSSPLVRFFIGLFIMIGASIFLGCPVKAVLRLAVGDLTALFALLGFSGGVWCGLEYLRGGFTLEREKELSPANALVLPLLMLFLLLFLLLKPSFILLGHDGPAVMHAPIWISLLAGLMLGWSGQRSTFCMMAGFRNFFLAKDTKLLMGIITLLLVTISLSLTLGKFKLGLNGQPGSHLAHGWTFLGMFLVGSLSVLANGCPFRQVIMAGEGNTDAAMVFLGMLIGGGIVQTWGLRSTLAGPPFLGKVAVLIGVIFFLTLGMGFRLREKKEKTIFSETQLIPSRKE